MDNQEKKPLPLQKRIAEKCELDVLFSLYVHRSLTPVQLHRIAGPYYKINSFRNRLADMYTRRLLLKKIERFSGDTLHYSLSTQGLALVLEEIGLDADALAMIEATKKDKVHYRLDDLVIGKQVAHHYYIQDWITRFLNYFIKYEYFFPNCEWRRFPYLDSFKEVRYRPDWLIFFPNDYFHSIMMKQDYIRNPLHFPYKFRQKYDWDIKFKTLIMLECDMGGMDLERLRKKWRLIRENRDHIGKTLAVFSPIDRINLNGDLLKLNGRRHLRIKSIRKSLLDELERLMCENLLRVFVGDEHQSVEACRLFVEDNDFYHYELKFNWDELLQGTYHIANSPELLYEANRTESKYFDPKPEEYIICRREDQTIFELQFIFRSKLGWLNPHAKVQRLKKCMKYSTMMPIKYILIYPNKEELMEDTLVAAEDVYYVLLDEIEEIGWGNAYKLLRVHERPKWLVVNLLEEQHK